MNEFADGGKAILTDMSQDARQVRAKTALAENHLVFGSMHMTEGLSTLFRMELELYSDDPGIDHDKVLGHNVTVGLKRPKGGPRFFNGYVTSFGYSGISGRKYVYRATASPWLWFLTQTENCRIFHKKDAVAIAEQIFREHGFTAFYSGFTGPQQGNEYSRRELPKYEYCVQYQESDFNFVSRLFEKEGIYYHFEHRNGRHVLWLVDSMGDHAVVGGYDIIDFVPDDAHAKERRDGILSWRTLQSVRPTKYVHQAYDFEQPRADLTTHHAIPRGHDAANLEIYRYPGDYTDTATGTGYATIRVQERQAGFDVAQGHGTSRGIVPGHRFTLDKHPVKAINASYLVTNAHYEIHSDEYVSGGEEEESVFSCSFSAIPMTETYRPPRRARAPKIAGPQTAVVWSDKDEEIDVDEHGRVKVMFHWPRNEEASCRVRVSQFRAGAGWGAVSHPRVGQEVIVEFQEGNPDRPIITGAVYNAKSEYPYPPKDKPTITTIKTNSSKDGGGFNELRFEDKKGKENVFLHAERSMDVRVKGTKRESIGYEHHQTIKKSEFRRIEEDKHEHRRGRIPSGDVGRRLYPGERQSQSGGSCRIDADHLRSQHHPGRQRQSYASSAMRDYRCKAVRPSSISSPSGIEIVGPLW